VEKLDDGEIMHHMREEEEQRIFWIQVEGVHLNLFILFYNVPIDLFYAVRT
jgi:hypothetical protein